MNKTKSDKKTPKEMAAEIISKIESNEEAKIILGNLNDDRELEYDHFKEVEEMANFLEKATTILNAKFTERQNAIKMRSFLEKATSISKSTNSNSNITNAYLTMLNPNVDQVNSFDLKNIRSISRDFIIYFTFKYSNDNDESNSTYPSNKNMQETQEPYKVFSDVKPKDSSPPIRTFNVSERSETLNAAQQPEPDQILRSLSLPAEFLNQAEVNIHFCIKIVFFVII